ncbi:hypothetical protein MKW98_030320, partial [Papaver atlanticum]
EGVKFYLDGDLVGVCNGWLSFVSELRDSHRSKESHCRERVFLLICIGKTRTVVVTSREFHCRCFAVLRGRDRSYFQVEVHGKSGSTKVKLTATKARTALFSVSG